MPRMRYSNQQIGSTDTAKREKLNHGGWPSIRSKALSRQKSPVRCVSAAIFAREVEDQSSGLNHAASPKRVWRYASPTIDTVFNGRP
jgi:hypothetical protein